MALPAEMTGGEAVVEDAGPTDADLAALVDEVDAATPEPEAVIEDIVPAEGEAAAKPAEAEAKPPVDETPDAAKLRKGFAALARDRRKMHDREQEATATIERAKGFEAKATQRDTIVQRLHDDPHALLLEAGGEELVNKFLEQCGSSAKSPAEIEVAKLRSELDARTKKAEAEASQRQVAEWQRGIINEVEKAGEKYDLVNSLGHHDAVIETIVQYHQKYNGAVLPVDVAAQAVEARLAAGLGKSKKFGPREAVKPPVTKAPPAPQKKGGLTLTSLGNGEPSTPSNGAAPVDDDARFNQTLAELATEGFI